MCNIEFLMSIILYLKQPRVSAWVTAGALDRTEIKKSISVWRPFLGLYVIFCQHGCTQYSIGDNLTIAEPAKTFIWRACRAYKGDFCNSLSASLRWGLSLWGAYLEFAILLRVPSKVHAREFLSVCRAVIDWNRGEVRLAFKFPPLDI